MTPLDRLTAALSVAASAIRCRSGEKPLTVRELVVLLVLGACEEEPRFSQLAKLAGLPSLPALTRILDRLAAEGLAERIADDCDRRTVRIRLTEGGRTLLAHLEKAMIGEKAPTEAPQVGRQTPPASRYAWR